ncbi:MAG: hypothetical protein AAB656_00775 [Patescibacteria group bacterium]
MRKEVIFAILAGATLGLIIAFGIWRANTAIKPLLTPSPAPSSEPATAVDLSIAKPDNQSVVTTSTVTIEGITLPDSQVAISGESKNYAVQATNKGSFSQKVELIGGLNEIKVFTFDKNGSSKQKTLLLVYSSEFAKYKEEPVATSSDSVRAKVDQKIEEAKSSPTSYIGAITDITDTNIQLKSLTGDIEQVSFNKDATDFIKTTNDTVKTISAKDLAIGDFIIAMGVRDGNKILTGKRILVTDPYKESARTAIFVTISKIEKKVVTAKDKDNKETTLAFGTDWDGPELKELKLEDKIIVIGEVKDTTLTVSLVKKI